MKIKLDYITNSSSSSYLIATKASIEEFSESILPEIIKDCYNNEVDLKIIRSFLITDSKEIKSKRKVFIIYYHSLFERDKVKNEILENFSNFSEDIRFYLTDEISDKDGQIAEELDSNNVFDYERIKEIPDLEIFYMNHH